jgi:hypothetical protein
MHVGVATRLVMRMRVLTGVSDGRSPIRERCTREQRQGDDANREPMISAND